MALPGVFSGAVYGKDLRVTIKATSENSQTITFSALAKKTYGIAPFTVSATASRGLTPTRSIVSGPAADLQALDLAVAAVR